MLTCKHYNPKWEKEEIFNGKCFVNITKLFVIALFTNILQWLISDWLQPTPENDVINGKPEAYCKVCKCFIRAQKNDLVTHAKSRKHTTKVDSFDRSRQKDLRTCADRYVLFYILIYTISCYVLFGFA